VDASYPGRYPPLADELPQFPQFARFEGLRSSNLRRRRRRRQQQQPAEIEAGADPASCRRQQ